MVPTKMPTKLNQLLELRRFLKKHRPDISTRLNPPAQPGGFFFLDVELDGEACEVEWRPGVGLGICYRPGEALYGQGADDVVASAKEAAMKVVAFLTATKAARRAGIPLPQPPSLG